MLDKQEKLLKGQRLTEKAVFLEGLLAAGKVIIGLLSGSVVLISDALHSVSDIVTIATSWLGLKIARKQADDKFRYGYFKAENIATLVVSGLILYTGVMIFREGFKHLFEFSSLQLAGLALAISFTDAVVLFLFGNYEVKIGREVGAQSLIAMGKENRTHIFSSTAVFIGILASYFRVPYIEGIITMAISLLVIKIGFETGKDAVLALMDVSPDEKVEKEVEKTIRGVAGVEDCFDLRLRKAGPFILGEVKVGVRKSIDVKRAHEIANKVESEVKRITSEVDYLVVHVEPYISKYQHIALPIKDNNGLDSEVESKFSRAAYFLFVNVHQDKVKGCYSIKNPYRQKEVRAGLAVAKLVAKQKVGIVITHQMGEITFYTLRENLVDIYRFKGRSAKNAVNKYLKNELVRITKPIQNI